MMEINRYTYNHACSPTKINIDIAQSTCTFLVIAKTKNLKPAILIVFVTDLFRPQFYFNLFHFIFIPFHHFYFFRIP